MEVTVKILLTAIVSFYLGFSLSQKVAANHEERLLVCLARLSSCDMNPVETRDLMERTLHAAK